MVKSSAAVETLTVPQPTASPLTNLGFLTVLSEANGYLGGYLVTNLWGRPLEFRLSTVVQPNRVQQILYGNTLVPYVCADLIGKALVEKTSTPAQLLLTDQEALLELRWKVETPVAWYTSEPVPNALPVRDGTIRVHPRFPQDVAVVGDWLEKLEGLLDLQEPFGRIREAIAEARKMGVLSRG